MFRCVIMETQRYVSWCLIYISSKDCNKACNYLVAKRVTREVSRSGFSALLLDVIGDAFFYGCFSNMPFLLFSFAQKNVPVSFCRISHVLSWRVLCLSGWVRITHSLYWIQWCVCCYSISYTDYYRVRRSWVFLAHGLWLLAHYQ